MVSFPYVLRYPFAPNTLIGGKYRVRNDQTILTLLPSLHRDPKVSLSPLLLLPLLPLLPLPLPPHDSFGFH